MINDKIRFAGYEISEVEIGQGANLQVLGDVDHAGSWRKAKHYIEIKGIAVTVNCTRK